MSIFKNLVITSMYYLTPFTFTDAPDVNISRTGSQLTCTATGVPATYTFYDIEHVFLGVMVRRLPGSPTYGGTFRTVDVGPLDFQARGNYTCTVQNGVSKNDALNQTNTFSVEVPGILVMALSTIFQSVTIVMSEVLYNINLNNKRTCTSTCVHVSKRKPFVFIILFKKCN